MNNIICNVDTDSIMIAKPDGSVWSKEEQKAFLDALNAQFPEKISFEHDGYFDSVVIIKSKNYALLLNPEYAKPSDLDANGNVKIKTKGSSIRDQKKEPALREMMDKMIDAMIYGRQFELPAIYLSYIKEALNVKDISRWSQKKSVTEAILDCKENAAARKNESDVYDAIKNEVGTQQGDKIYLYPVILGYDVKPGGVSKKTGKPLKDKVKEVTGLRLAKYWTNDHDVLKLVDRVYSTLKIFKTVLDMDQYLDYTKKANIKLLEELKLEVVS